jgi:chemotaxis protein CheY-P-specific phosphatase CheC
MQPRAFQIQGDPQDITTLKWVYILPSNILQTDRKKTLEDLYQTFHRMMFLTNRKVWFKNRRTQIEQRIMLVPSPHLLSKCDKMFLKKKGYPVKTNGCERDSCRQCRDGRWL